jgi:prepilin-type N-terminal cleavage/methylation domain-containing protein
VSERGFTLVEVMMVTFISSFVFAGVLSAYIFLGRGLVREGNAEQVESGTRTAFYYFTQDVSSASSITAQSSQPQITLTTAGSGTVTYAYDPVNFTLTRTATVGTSSLTLLSPSKSGLSSLNLSFTYYDVNGNLISTIPSAMIKQVIMAYSATTGSAVSGAQSFYSGSSPLVIMKNKASLQ